MLRALLGNRSRSVVAAIGLMAACGGVGCAAGRGDQQAPLKPTNNSTNGADLEKAPKGTTIPAAGFGVDLVGYEQPASRRNPSR